MSAESINSLKKELSKLNKTSDRDLRNNPQLISTFEKLFNFAKGQSNGKDFNFYKYLKTLKN